MLMTARVVCACSCYVCACDVVSVRNLPITYQGVCACGVFYVVRVSGCGVVEMRVS